MTNIRAVLIKFKACLQTCGNEAASGRKHEWHKIINGVTPDVNSWPFLVRLFFSNAGENTGFVCGGTVLRQNFFSRWIKVLVIKLFSDRWVLTAAHCCGSEREEAPGVVTPFDEVSMAFGEHTVFQGASVPESLKQDRFFMFQQNSGP